MAFRNLVLLAVFLGSFSPVCGWAQDYLRPPFGLFWGEESAQLEKMLKGAKAKITDRNTENGVERWTVSGIIQPALKQANFYFQDKSLIGIELQYANDKWDTEKYKTFMDKFRAKIEGRFGKGTLINREKGPQEDVTQTMVGYQWKQDDTDLELIYFAVEKEDLAFRTVSLHYRYVPMELPPLPEGNEELKMDDLPPLDGEPAADEKKKKPKDVTPEDLLLPVKKEGESAETLQPATGAGIGGAPTPTPEASPTPAPPVLDPAQGAASPTPSPTPQ